TTINYTIAVKGFITIKVYDVLGKVISTLVNEEKTSGNYKVEFNGSKLSSGVYFYRMQAGSFVETKKLILMK
ncbi:MAG: T9SS type A sorting domain-containing protein, partial [Ignavibacteriaceae bacterium]